MLFCLHTVVLFVGFKIFTRQTYWRESMSFGLKSLPLVSFPVDSIMGMGNGQIWISYSRVLLLYPF